MPKFGGPGTKRQSCQRRRCHDMTPARAATGARAAPPPPPPRPPPTPPAQSQPQSLPQSPPHLAVSPPHLAVSPPHLAVSPPHLAPMSIEDAAFLAAGLDYLRTTSRLLTDSLLPLTAYHYLLLPITTSHDLPLPRHRSWRGAALTRATAAAAHAYARAHVSTPLERGREP